MKNTIFSFALCTGSLLTPTIGNTQIFPYSTIILDTQSDDIDLRGRIEPGEIRKTGPAISAVLQENSIKADFNFNMGTVQITIVNETDNTVYSAIVASSLGEILIPTSGLPSGNYSIIFVAANGEMYGDFTL